VDVGTDTDVSEVPPVIIFSLEVIWANTDTYLSTAAIGLHRAPVHTLTCGVTGRIYIVHVHSLVLFTSTLKMEVSGRSKRHQHRLQIQSSKPQGHSQTLTMNRSDFLKSVMPTCISGHIVQVSYFYLSVEAGTMPETLCFLNQT
jgi:hypothetical protein